MASRPSECLAWTLGMALLGAPATCASLPSKGDEGPRARRWLLVPADGRTRSFPVEVPSGSRARPGGVGGLPRVEISFEGGVAGRLRGRILRGGGLLRSFEAYPGIEPSFGPVGAGQGRFRFQVVAGDLQRFLLLRVGAGPSNPGDRPPSYEVRVLDEVPAGRSRSALAYLSEVLEPGGVRFLPRIEVTRVGVSPGIEVHRDRLRWASERFELRAWLAGGGSDVLLGYVLVVHAKRLMSLVYVGEGQSIFPMTARLFAGGILLATVGTVDVNSPGVFLLDDRGATRLPGVEAAIESLAEEGQRPCGRPSMASAVDDHRCVSIVEDLRRIPAGFSVRVAAVGSGGVRGRLRRVVPPEAG